MPWPSVEFALGKVGGGNTIVLKPGIYGGPVRIARAYAGSPNSPTVIRSEVKWKAVIQGSAEHGVYAADGCDWVVVDGLEVAGARIDGIKISGDNGVVRNCWVHGSGGQGIAIHGKKGWTIENCLVEFNGQNVQLHHGIYADGENFTVRNNVVRHNSGYGMQLYPAARGGRVVNNLVYGQARKGGMVLQAPEGGGKNVIANNTIADNAYGISIYAGKGEVLANNIFAGPSAIVTDSRTTELTVDYNLCAPECVQGPNGATGDPRFVYAARGAYWLDAASPAIGRGTREYAPETDFWGRARQEDAPVDLGAFAFVPYLTTPEARVSWYNGWAYRYSPGDPRMEMPDLWANPEGSGGSAAGAARVQRRRGFTRGR
jgi:parallel beta-helix repeat protein